MDRNALKQERLKKGFTQAYMADQLGFKSRASYCLIEGGETSVSVELAKKISIILGLSQERTTEIFLQ